MSADHELSSILDRRQKINEALESGEEVKHHVKPNNIRSEFTRSKLKEYKALFDRFDTGADGYLDLYELQHMMEKLGVPQTHIGLKTMIAEIDDDKDNKISFVEFLMIFKKANDGDLHEDSGLAQLARQSSIDVGEEGVCGAKHFFEAKIEQQSLTNKFADEIRKEKEERQLAEEQKEQSRAQFQQRAAVFSKQ